ncbi:hypothetical protein L209DRAFT_395686 [Thermothelomyces heterothallicus CBS 203.75]
MNRLAKSPRLNPIGCCSAINSTSSVWLLLLSFGVPIQMSTNTNSPVMTESCYCNRILAHSLECQPQADCRPKTPRIIDNGPDDRLLGNHSPHWS